MFARTALFRAVSPFTLFIKQAYKTKELKDQLAKLPLLSRGRKLGQLYRALPRGELAKLKAAAAKAPSLKRRPPVVRKPNAYAKFVAKQMKTPAIQRLAPATRMAAVAKQWAAKGAK
jgi:hypothetical protein